MSCWRARPGTRRSASSSRSCRGRPSPGADRRVPLAHGLGHRRHRPLRARRSDRSAPGELSHRPARVRAPRFFSTAKYLVDPVRDDAPFFWHFTRFRDAIMSPLPEERSIENPRTRSPSSSCWRFSASRWSSPRRSSCCRSSSSARLGRDAAEGTRAHVLRGPRTRLHVRRGRDDPEADVAPGYPTYSLSVTLFALLVFSGLGSLASERLTLSRNRTLGTAFGVLAAWVLWPRLASCDHRFCRGRDPRARIAVTIALVAPMGLCLGASRHLGSAPSPASRHGPANTSRGPAR